MILILKGHRYGPPLSTGTKIYVSISFDVLMAFLKTSESQKWILRIFAELLGICDFNGLTNYESKCLL